MRHLTRGAALEDRSALLSSTTIDIAIGTSDYGFMSGTSMATPAVSGIAALVWSNHPECTGTEIRDALKATAQDQGASGHDVYFGHGIVKAADADAYLMANGCAGGNNGGGSGRRERACGPGPFKMPWAAGVPQGP